MDGGGDVIRSGSEKGNEFIFNALHLHSPTQLGWVAWTWIIIIFIISVGSQLGFRKITIIIMTIK